MAALCDVSNEAQDDLFEIWARIATDSVTLANRIDEEFYQLFASLARTPLQGHSRKDLTHQPVLFLPCIHSWRSTSLKPGRFGSSRFFEASGT